MIFAFHWTTGRFVSAFVSDAPKEWKNLWLVNSSFVSLCVCVCSLVPCAHMHIPCMISQFVITFPGKFSSPGIMMTQKCVQDIHECTWVKQSQSVQSKGSQEGKEPQCFRKKGDYHYTYATNMVRENEKALIHNSIRQDIVLQMFVLKVFSSKPWYYRACAVCILLFPGISAFLPSTWNHNIIIIIISCITAATTSFPCSILSDDDKRVTYYKLYLPYT